MSLTRADWVEMWEAIQSIQRSAISVHGTNYAAGKLAADIKIIKDRIQQVIGQME